jgi:hypothetical protein
MGRVLTGISADVLMHQPLPRFIFDFGPAQATESHPHME